MAHHLALLIESVERADYLVNTMDVTKHDFSTRREGEIRLLFRDSPGDLFPVDRHFSRRDDAQSHAIASARRARPTHTAAT